VEPRAGGRQDGEGLTSFLQKLQGYKFSAKIYRSKFSQETWGPEFSQKTRHAPNAQESVFVSY
jgi:hypothetical protein